MGETPSVFEFESSRAYLNALYAVRKARNRRYSQRSFALSLGLSGSMLGYLLKGQRALSPDSARSLADRLPLGGESDREYFFLLSRLDSARNPLDRERLRKELRGFRRRRPPVKWPEEHYQLALHPHALTVLEACALRAVGEAEIDSIADQLRIPTEEVESLLAAHHRAGLLRRNEDGSYARIAEELFIPPAAVRKKSDVRYRHTLHQADLALEGSELADRVYAASYLPIRRADLPEFRRRIYALLDEFHDATGGAVSPDSVYGLAIGFFKALELGGAR